MAWMLKRASVAAGTAVAVAALGATGASAAGRSTVCNAAGAPDSSTTVGVPHVVHATVNTCGAENTPPNPPCSFAVDQPGLIHLKIYACQPVTIPVSFGPAGVPNPDPASYLPQGNTTPPPDCGTEVDRMVGPWEVFACTG